ncbi:MAG: helix-hairpin-helix domain-containing protein, partial [Actinomycetota bacterium]
MITILALAILTTVAVSLSVTARLEVRAARRGVDEVQREAALRGAVNRGIALLDRGRDDPETLLSTLRQYERLEWRPFAPEAEGVPRLEMALQILDASARLNLNTADANQLQNIPGLSERTADKILSWRDEESKDNYSGGPRGYEPKRRPFDTIEELLLVREVDAGRFFGASTARQTASLPRPPVREWLTTLSGETNTDAAGNPRVDVNSASSDELLTAANSIQQCVTPQQMLSLMEKRRQRQSNRSSGRPFASVSEALREGGIEEQRWGPVMDAWTVDRREFLPLLAQDFSPSEAAA